MDIGARLDDRRNQGVERLRVGGDLHLEPEAFANAHDGDAVQTDGTGEDHDVAHGRPIGADGDPGGDQADARGVDE